MIPTKACEEFSLFYNFLFDVYLIAGINTIEKLKILAKPKTVIDMIELLSFKVFFLSLKAFCDDQNRHKEELISKRAEVSRLGKAKYKGRFR